MKKNIILSFVLFVIYNNVYSQTTEEWTQQKKTQKKYLLQQIAALHTYIGYAKRGYNIASKGINTVSNIKNGDFNLHRDFFGSLKNINPKIKKYARLADLLAYQYRIIKKTKQVITAIQQTSQLNTDEIDYCKKVFDNLLDECVKTISEVITVLTPNEFTMKDDERMKRIDKIYFDMQDKYAFCSSFSDEMGVLVAQRMAEQYEINRSKILNGIK
ncbi:MAG: hypothetical protein ACKVOW_13240 [Chitinophagaceae bacterium]